MRYCERNTPRITLWWTVWALKQDDDLLALRPPHWPVRFCQGIQRGPSYIQRLPPAWLSGHTQQKPSLSSPCFLSHKPPVFATTLHLRGVGDSRFLKSGQRPRKVKGCVAGMMRGNAYKVHLKKEKLTTKELPFCPATRKRVELLWRPVDA